MSRRVDQIEAGFYEIRLVSGGPPVAARITYGPPDDPITGEPLDRSWRHRLFILGEEVDDLDRLWNVAITGKRIDEARHEYLIQTHRWEVDNRPDLPAASPRQRVNLGRTPLLF